ncbi:hypothetical protein ACOMHN_035055 [Nucella lapillus]
MSSLVAAKSDYFGVGGGVSSFVHYLQQADPQFTVDVRTLSGTSRTRRKDSLGVQWFQKVSLHHCGSERPPQLLVLDSHEALELLEKAKEEDVYLYALASSHHQAPSTAGGWFGASMKGLPCSVHRGVRKPCTQREQSQLAQTVPRCLGGHPERTNEIQ